MISWNVGIHCNSFADELDLSFFVAHFSQSLPFEVIKLAFFCKCEPLFTTFTQFLPIPQSKPSLDSYEIFFFSFLHSLDEIEDLAVLFFCLQFFEGFLQILAII